jgi:pimeloyl-ACP methyl ester carboxylesterase
MSSSPQEVGIGSMIGFLEMDQSEVVREVRLPIRCINSSMYPVSTKFNKTLALSYEVVVMEDVGHFVMLEDPETFNYHLTEIVRELTEAEKKE